VYLYDVYGLTIGSDIAIPELLPSPDRGGTAEINLGLADPPNRLTTISDWLVSTASPSGAPWLSWAKITRGYVLRFHDLADFLVDSEGRHVTCVFAASDVSAATLRHLVIDHVLPRVLNLRGFDALHATAVVIEDRVCAFVAEAGTGKSTLAASFHLAGYPAFCDDCLVLRDTRPLTVLPAYPGVRLWEPSFHALGGSAATLGVAVAQYTAKTRQLGSAEGFRAEPLPLARIYLLERKNRSEATAKSSPQLQQLKPGDAMPALMAATFPLDITDHTMLTRHFRLLSRAAAELPIRRLTIPTDFAALPAARSLILEDCAIA
jgi:hypothetical protein